MSFMEFDKTQLINLEYSLPKEVLLTNAHGDYASSTIIGCNTRKYHGLLVPILSSIDGNRHVLLSSVHETIIQHEQEFNLGIHSYPGDYNPKGHKYARWFEFEPTWKMIYRVGGVVLQKEILLVPDHSQVLIRYTLLEAHSQTWIRIKPFLAFRSVHQVGKANMLANTRIKPVSNGISCRLYLEYPDLFMQVSRQSNFVPAPDWYLQIQYSKEIRRGYDGHEDLFVPGYFELQLKKGQPIVFSAGLDQVPSKSLTSRFSGIIELQPSRKTFMDMLSAAASSFIIRNRKGVGILPGYHWFGAWGRHVFIALPGLTLALGKKDLFDEIIESMLKRRKGALFPDHSPDINRPVYGSADVSLWFIWALSEAQGLGEESGGLWKSHKVSIERILESYRDGSIEGVKMTDNGLIDAYLPNRALTWMDAYVNGQPVTHRPGLTVEVNALWYNALAFACDIASEAGDLKFLKKWQDLKEKVENSFVDTFWSEEKGYLADYVWNGESNWDVRPNQLFAAAFRYSPLPDEIKNAVLEVVRKELLTPRGVRTLSPRHEDFQVSYEGGPVKRDLAYHQGTVWPWLLGFFADAWLRLHGKSGKNLIQNILLDFEEEMFEHGIGTLSEVYDGNPPHNPCGAISFASSVSAIIWTDYLMKKI